MLARAIALIVSDGSRDPRRLLKALAAIAVLLLGVRRFVPAIPLQLIAHEAADLPDPSGEPAQEEAERDEVLELPRARLHVKAWFDVSAEVKSATRYWIDGGAWLIPWDLAIAWGGLLEPPYAGSVDFHQNARFSLWGTSNLQLDRSYIISHSANVHVIPATSAVKRALSHVRPGDRVRLEGELVEIEGTGAKEGFRWRTSLSRSDTDGGSCETMYLRKLNVEGKLYR